MHKSLLAIPFLAVVMALPVIVPWASSCFSYFPGPAASCAAAGSAALAAPV